MPGDVPIPWDNPVFASLNSTEIVIAGGWDRNNKTVGNIVTFNTTTCEFKREVLTKDGFICNENWSVNVCENTIIAIVFKSGSYHALKYTKGDTGATILFKVGRLTPLKID